MKIYEEIQNNIAEWERFIEHHIGASAQLISVSNLDGNRRVYRIENRIAKVRKVSRGDETRANDLRGEYEILKELNGVDGVCQNSEYHKEPGWEFLTYDFAPGESLENLLREGDFIRDEKILWEILKIVARVNRRGIAHRDIKPGNIIVDKNGKASIIDFDQAVRINAPHAMLIDILGIGNSKKVGHFCFENLTQRYFTKRPLWLRLISFLLKPLRKINSLMAPSQEPRLPKNFCFGDQDLLNLQKAWKIAENADANSPGAHVAYYSFDAGSFHLSGERPWILRWSKIYNKISFKGKRVIECGCNLGLLGAFARNAGAKECVGVDLSDKILTGARLVSKALHADNKFFQNDFDSVENWEEKFPGFDMVIAFSVVNWLKNRDRFIAFLGRHNEALYEGHDSISVETERLKGAGFKVVDLIFTSERNRAVFYAHK